MLMSRAGLDLVIQLLCEIVAFISVGHNTFFRFEVLSKVFLDIIGQVISELFLVSTEAQHRCGQVVTAASVNRSFKQ